MGLLNEADKIAAAECATTWRAKREAIVARKPASVETETHVFKKGDRVRVALDDVRGGGTVDCFGTVKRAGSSTYDVLWDNAGTAQRIAQGWSFIKKADETNAAGRG